jgi:uncharacterized protein YdaU (DUF1376 family)
MATDERYAAFLFYVEDWLSSTAIDLMTAAEERGYLRLLLHAWKSLDCSLPNDDRVLARLSRLDGEWHTGSGAVVRSEFFERDGRLYNVRLLRERENQRAIRQARSGAGKAGAEARWNRKRIVLPIANECGGIGNNDTPVSGVHPEVGQMDRVVVDEALEPEAKSFKEGSPDSKRMVSPMANGWQNDASSSSSSSLNTTTKTLCSSGDERGGETIELIPPKPKPADEILKWFDGFWELYPRKVAKPKALAAARRHGKTYADRTAIMECLKRRLPALQEQFKSDGDYRPYPATWLNQTPWLDPVEADRPPAVPRIDGKGSSVIDEAMRLYDARLTE